MHPIIQKTRDDYNKIARHFSTTRFKLWPGMEQFKEFLSAGQCVLDWGCGSGRLLELLRQYPLVRYYGVDISTELLQIARARYASLIKKGMVHFYCTGKRAKNFPPRFFDVAFLIASFHHLPTSVLRLKLLQKIHRELKKDGKIIMMNWHLESNWSEIQEKKGWKRIGPQDILVPWKNSTGQVEVERFYHSFTPEELTDLLARSGFKLNYSGYDTITEWSDAKMGRNLVTIASKG